jgi:hypothetical protein
VHGNRTASIAYPTLHTLTTYLDQVTTCSKSQVDLKSSPLIYTKSDKFTINDKLSTKSIVSTQENSLWNRVQSKKEVVSVGVVQNKQQSKISNQNNTDIRSRRE